MVHYKRKPVVYIEPPRVYDRAVEVWVMRETNEVFLDYDGYLQRLDYYRQRKFTCDITGHTNLTFFEALESEMEESRDLDSSFPEPLREPVLRKVQFSTISRIDELVNHVFMEFKQDFFPREHVIISTKTGERLEGIVREKVQFAAVREPDGKIRPPVSRYVVKLDDVDGSEALAEGSQLSRDRRIFTKQMLRSFLKRSVTRESWLGAPWTVKEHLAREYRIPTEIPRELQYDVRMAEKKLAALRKAEAEEPFKNSFASKQVDIRSMFPALGGLHAALPQGPGQSNGFPQGFNMLGSALTPENFPNGMSAATKFHHFASNFQPIATKEVQQPMAPPPPPPIKYPIEDLDIKPKRNGVKRPPLKYFSDDTPTPKSTSAYAARGLQMRSIGPLLEIWNTLNVHCEVYILDSFTFDDFVDAMLFQSDDVTCELFVEVHCSILKQLVNEDGDLQVSLPDLPEESEDESEEEEEEEPSPEPEPEEPPRRRTRSSFAKEEALKNEKTPTPEPEEGPPHRAAEMLAEKDWIERLKERDFRLGGWEVIMVGLLWQVSHNPREQAICEEILTHLAPPDMEPTQETAWTQYTTLDANLRVAALEIACMLSVRTKAIRAFLEQCSEQMTELRKEKIEVQRRRKPLIDELRELDEQRKILLPENMPGTPPPETNGDGTPDVSMTGMDEEEEGSVETEEDDEAPRRNLRRANDRANERKRKREEEVARKEKEKKEKLEAKAAGKQSAQFKKLLKDIEKKKDAIKKCEDQIVELDNDLREANCQRTKVLGRDRFCYRYYWYERNGMPYGGLPNSSTADYGYANARIWVQGPDDMEREGYLDLPEAEMKEYANNTGMNIEERRQEDEGDARLLNAHQWGYIDDPEDVDKLIDWLDERGKREKALRKELTAWRDQIVEYMSKLKSHRGDSEKKNDEEADEEEANHQATPRVSTRTKTYIDLDATSHRCLHWSNSYAIRELGHLHSEPSRPRKGKKAALEKERKLPHGKSKPATRQR